MKSLFICFSLLSVVFSSSTVAEAQQYPLVPSFSLLRADTGGTLIGALKSGQTIDLAKLPTRNLVLRANTNPALVNRVEFSLNGSPKAVDRTRPYTLLGDNGTASIGWTPAPGSYLIEAVPYDKTTLRIGTPGSISLNFVVGTSTTTTTTTTSTTSTSTTTSITTLTTAATATTTTAPTSTLPRGPLAVFPGAEGFGTTTPAGSGRHLASPSTTVFKITSLADSGSGTLRECVQASVPRVCVFEISGRIDLATQLTASKPYLTIAGETAPAPGIMLAGATLRIWTHDVLIRHMKIRVGDGPTGPAPSTRDGIAIGSSSSAAYNVVLDHLSVSWAIDENLGTGYPTTHDVTVSNSIISEGLYRSIHPDGPHSKGILVGEDSKNITIHDSLLAHNQDRNPRMNPGADVEFINNVVYNWGGTTGWNQANLADTALTGKAVRLNFIGNYFKPGPNSPLTASIYAKPPAATSRVYVLENIGPTRPDGTGSEWNISGIPESPYRSLSPALTLSGVLPRTAKDTLSHVLASAGARPQEADPVDNRIVSEVISGGGGLKDCVSGCTASAGGYPAWAVNRRTLTLPANPNADDDGNGYTNLEQYLQSFAAALE